MTALASPPPPPPPSPHAAVDLDDLESRASDAVSRVRSIVDAVRSVDELSAAAATGGKKARVTASGAVVSAVVSGARRSSGSEEGDRRAEGEIARPESSARLCPALRSAGLTFGDAGEDVVDDDDDDAGGESDRRRAVRSVLLPALTDLAESYAALDSAVAAAAERTDDGDAGGTGSLRRGGNGSRKKKPPPPRGLLSVADYTDVACLLEFAVCASILPHLERGVLPPAPLRAKLHPRSMAGRLPRRALLWGSAVKAASRRRRTAARRESDDKMGKAAELGDAADELRRTSEAVGKAVLSDRFRPMLLPRHAADVLAATFQAERFEAAAKAIKSRGEKASNGASAAISGGPRSAVGNYREIVNLFLGEIARTPQSPSPSPSGQTCSYLDAKPVNPHTRARAYRTLLAGGTSNSPPWLRRRVGSLLTSLAVVDLRPVVDAFVGDASSAPGSDATAAAVRLGRVLCAPPSPSDRTAESSDADGGGGKGGYYAELFREVASLLDGTWSAAGSDGAAAGAAEARTDARFDAGPATAWAVLSNAPLPLLRRHFLPHLIRGMVPNAEAAASPARCVRRSVRRICALLSRAPAAAGEDGTAAKVCDLLLSPLDPSAVSPPHADASESDAGGVSCAGVVSALGQLIRISAAGGDNVVRCSSCAEDAVWAARMIVRAAMTARAIRGADESRGERASQRNGGVSGEDAKGGSPRGAEGDEGRRRSKAAAVALVRAVCTNPLDGGGYRFRRRRSESSSPAAAEHKVEVEAGEDEDVIILEQRNIVEDKDAGAVMSDLMEDMEGRARLVVERIVAPLCPASSSSLGRKGGSEQTGKSAATDGAEPSSKSVEKRSCANLPNSLFHLLLLIYLGGLDANASLPSPSSATISSRLLPWSLLQDIDGALLASMVLLPLCCERCPPESLLLWNDGSDERGEGTEGGGGVLDLILLVLYCAASQFGLGNNTPAEMEEVPIPSTDDRCSFADCDVEVPGARRPPDDVNRDFTPSSVLGDSENVLSISSLVLSLLVAMLELGTTRRNEGEEETLRAMTPLLHAIAAPPSSDQGPARPMTASAESAGATSASAARAEMAEMASHAMALISARSAEASPLPYGAGPSGEAAPSKEASVAELIGRAEGDLKSDQPPIRARGVVALRRIAQGCLSLSNGGPRAAVDRPLIEVVDPCRDESPGGNALGSNRDAGHGALAEGLARIAVEALSDSESYVFLAAIQTIVAIADLCPATILPKLGAALSTGHLRSYPLTDDQAEEETVLQLSLAQRTKLSEALMFAIRRRGQGIYVHGSVLMEMMMFGCGDRGQKDRISGGADQTDAQDFQRKTEAYFRISEVSDNDVEDQDQSTLTGERVLRVNTGGPVFDHEESDVVRACCVLVVAELVSVMPPSIICRYCVALMHLGKEVLRLESSRPLRRAAATLCRELYSVVLRQAEDESAGNLENAGMSVAVQMVSSQEDSLSATLRRCVSAEDVDHAEMTAVAGKRRLYDPATVARCEEALDARDAGEHLGIFAAASLIAASWERENRNPTTQAVLRKLRE